MDDVNLADHLGHKVIVAGSRVHETKMKEEKKEKYEKAESGGKEYADLKVNSVEMISNSCKSGGLQNLRSQLLAVSSQPSVS